MREQTQNLKKLLKGGMAAVLFSGVLASGSPALAHTVDNIQEDQSVNEVEQLQSPQDVMDETSPLLSNSYEMTVENYNISTDEVVKGTVSPATARVKLEVDGVLVRTFIPVDNQFGIYAKDKVKSKDQSVFIVAYDSKDNEQNRIRVNLVDSAPILHGLEDKSIELGTIFDPLAGVTATDATGKLDLTAMIVVTGTVDVANAGEYKLTYSVVQGSNTTSQTITVKVTAKETLVAPQVDPFSIDKVTVTGTVSGSATQVGIYVNGELKRTAAVTADRRFEIYVADLGVGTPGQITEVALIGEDGTVGAKTPVTVVQPEKVEVSANEYNITTDSYIKGTTSSVDYNIRLEVDGKIVRNYSPKTADYIIYARDHVTSVKQQVYIVVCDSAHVEKARTKVNLKENAPILTGVADKTIEIDSSFDPLAGVTATNYDGKINLTDQIKVSGEVDATTTGDYPVTYTVVYDGITVSKTIIIKVVETIPAPTIDTYYTHHVFATGKVGGSAKTVGVYVNGKLKRITAVQEDGTFKIYTGDLALTAEGKTFAISAFGKTGTEGPKSKSTVAAKLYEVTAQEFDLSKDVYVKGTVNEHVAKVSLEVDGKIVRSARAPGTDYIIYANDVLHLAGQKAYVVAHDSRGIERSRVQVNFSGNTHESPTRLLLNNLF